MITILVSGLTFLLGAYIGARQTMNYLTQVIFQALKDDPMALLKIKRELDK